MEKDKLHNVALYAPAGCTGYPGTIGDTIFESSIANTLMNMDLFPKIENLTWYSHKFAKRLFGNIDNSNRLNFVDVADSENPPEIKDKDLDTMVFCYYNPKAISSLNPDKKTRILCPKNQLNAHADAGPHITVQMHSTLEGILPENYTAPAPVICPVKTGLDGANGFMGANGLEKGNFSIYSISAGDPERAWSSEQWVNFIAKAHSHSNLPVVLSYSPDEELKAQEILRGCSDKRVIGGCFSLELLAALSQQSEFFVAPDSGPMQLMAASGARGYDIVSKCPPLVWAPLSDKVKVVGSYPSDIKNINPDKIIYDIWGPSS